MRTTVSNIVLLLMCQISFGFAQENEECVTKNQVPGLCTKFHSCTWLVNAIRTKQVNISDPSAIHHCGFDDIIPIVCCPTESDLSKPKKACRKYAEFVNPLENYILNGQITKLGDFPFMAVIGRVEDKKLKTYKWFCGGSLISKNFVLTAGHCVTSRIEFPEIVRLNDVNLAEEKSTDMDMDIAKIIKHPSYKTTQQYDDIALIKLATDVQFSKNLYPICLSADPSIEPGGVFNAIGFGLTEVKDHSDVLLVTELTIADGSVCNESYVGLAHQRRLPDRIRSTQFCAHDPAGKSNTCPGDSGAALTRKVKGQHTIFGVTSFGLACRSATLPSVYTRVSSYLNWIDNIVW